MENLKNMDFSNATLVDVRTQEEFDSGTVQRAVNIPLNTIPENLNRFKSMPSPVIVFCRSGARSGQATSWLKQNGVEVYNGGGINQMIEAMNVNS